MKTTILFMIYVHLLRHINPENSHFGFDPFMQEAGYI